jgi:phospholipid/cholesterol/gamma-HCH transport system permease protein
VMTLSFFIGAVIAFMGKTILSDFGASIFTVELVGFAVLREFGVLITAIILAGRSDSSFTAQIGSMKMTQEIDAMRILGLDPIDMLVVPRVIALLVMFPILTFLAMVAGIAGGGLVVVSLMDLSPTLFLSRLQQNVGVDQFWAGMAKSPAFAFVIAIIGCRQGLNVENDVISLGQNTTASVVQALFMVIILEAVFALLYMELGI